MKLILSILTSMVALSLAGCNTPPQKPYSAPQTQASRPPPPPPTQAQQAQEASPQPAGGEQGEFQAAAPTPPPPAPPEDSAATQNPPPPSGESADVQITDIPVDEDGNPIIDESRQNNTAQNSPNTEGDQPARPPASSGGGGSQMAANQRAIDRNSGGDSPLTTPGVEAGPNINIGSRTDPEHMAALEEDLDGRLAKFDELMRRAREQAELEREQAGGGGTGGGSGAPTGGSYTGGGARANPPPDGQGAGGQADRSSGIGHTPDLSGQTRQGDYQHAAAGPIPTDVADGRDDDIVARQLREAATRETDPVLREKLWDEYRKYKTGIGR